LEAREKALQEGSKEGASLKAEIDKLKVDAKKKQEDKQAAAAELEKSTQSAAAEAAKQKNNLAAIQKQKEAAEKELADQADKRCCRCSAQGHTAPPPGSDCECFSPAARCFSPACFSPDAGEKQRAASLEKAAKSAGDDQAQMQKELNTSRAEIDKLTKANAGVQAKLKAAQSDSENVKKQAERQQAASKVALDHLQAATKSKDKELKSQNKQLLHLQAVLKKAAQRLADQEVITEEVTRVNSRLTQENARLKTQVENMRQQESALQEKCDSSLSRDRGILALQGGLEAGAGAVCRKQKAKRSEKATQKMEMEMASMEMDMIQNDMDANAAPAPGKRRAARPRPRLPLVRRVCRTPALCCAQCTCGPFPPSLRAAGGQDAKVPAVRASGGALHGRRYASDGGAEGKVVLAGARCHGAGGKEAARFGGA
jgi:hypothetical protein